MSVIYNFKGIGRTNKTYEDLLQELQQKGKLSLSNDVAGWNAIARDGYFMISFWEKDENRFYKNAKSWAKRVSQLLNKGY